MNEQYIELGTTYYQENLCRKLNDLRNKEGLPIELCEISNGRQDGSQYLVRCVFLDVKCKNNNDRIKLKIYKYYFAKALAEIVLQEWERNFVRKVLMREYKDKNTIEIEQIFDKTCGYLNGKGSG